MPEIPELLRDIVGEFSETRIYSLGGLSPRRQSKIFSHGSSVSPNIYHIPNYPEMS